VSLTCPQQVVRVGLVESENDTTDGQAGILVTKMLRGCYEESAPVEIRLEFAHLVLERSYNLSHLI